MRMRLYLSLLFFTLLFLQCNLDANRDYKNVLAYNWINHPVSFYKNTIVDTTATPYALLLETLGEKKGILGSLMPILQMSKTNSAIEVRIKYKTEDCKNLSIIITSIGECENINSIDTIQLTATEEWTEVTRIINTKETYLLNTSIEAIGFNQNDAKIWISDFEILVNGKEIIDNSKLKYKKENIYLDKNDLIHWNNENYATFPFWKHKILAIGETVHGTKTMNDIAIAILKERILKHHCKLILLEIPLEYSFYINRYIKNDVDFKFTDISAYFDGYLYSDALISFMQWLKNYNLTSNERVSIWGFDVNHIQLKSRTDLFNFFYSLNMNRHLKELDTICEFLLDTEVSFEKIISMFKESSHLISLLDEDELKLMLHCLEITRQYSSTYYRFINRDKAMGEITTSIVDDFLKKNGTITIFGHIGHLNYLNGQDLSVMDYYSLGHYMKNKYRDEYSCIALITNQGSTMLTKSTEEFGVSELIPAPLESLEYQLNRLKMDSVYLPMNKLSCSDVLKLRFVGNQDIENQFRYIIPKSRMDGVVFIKESVHIDKKEDILKRNMNTNFIIMNSYKEALEKMKNE